MLVANRLAAMGSGSELSDFKTLSTRSAVRSAACAPVPGRSWREVSEISEPTLPGRRETRSRRRHSTRAVWRVAVSAARGACHGQRQTAIGSVSL